jgi:hypothetical protein
MAARILVKNSRMCRTGVLQDPVTPLRLWPRVVHDPHTAHPTDIMGTGVFTNPVTPSPVSPLANSGREGFNLVVIVAS